MSSTIGRGYSFGTTELCTNVKFHTLVDSATISGQVSSEVSDLNENTVHLLSATTVSLAANADTTLYTVPAGKRCILSHAILVAGADAATTDISIGADGTETDFLAVTDLGLINAAYDAAILQPIPAANVLLSKSYAAATVIQAQVTNQAGGATNTLYLFGTLY